MKTSLRLTVDSDDEVGDTETLLEWLRDEPELREHVSTVEQPPAAGRMGSLVEVIVAASASGGALTVLVSSLQAWLKDRKPVQLKVQSSDGTVIELSAKNVADAEALFKLANSREE